MFKATKLNTNWKELAVNFDKNLQTKEDNIRKQKLYVALAIRDSVQYGIEEVRRQVEGHLAPSSKILLDWWLAQITNWNIREKLHGEDIFPVPYSGNKDYSKLRHKYFIVGLRFAWALIGKGKAIWTSETIFNKVKEYINNAESQ